MSNTFDENFYIRRNAEKIAQQEEDDAKAIAGLMCLIARALDTTPGYVSKVRKEAAMDAKTHPVLDVVHTVTRGGENEI